MEVVFETAEGRRFEQEIWFFSSVLEMKEKIEKLHGFPVARQTLVFDGKVLENERDTEYYGIMHGSRILVRLEPDPNPPASAAEVSIAIPSHKTQFKISVDAASETVNRLKERIADRLAGETGDRMSTSRLVLLHAGGELQDQWRLAECGVWCGSEIEVTVKAPGGTAAVGHGARKVRLAVQLAGPGTKRVSVEVNPADNVGELRKELNRLREKQHFNLPAEGFFFIYNQNVMDEDRSFRWHDVRPGDVIEVFNGSVTGGT
ncbi:hypothetical protein HPP92_012386 [Vanilla planifolia]|uniref:Ubiquitin-like domain-containing protein n=1 Tax=Vanilla planifolia TaxID=51239 RepID=A0A835R0U7_VANPL|nr:hypothetical protein HPP92_012386 [Vanilla planifolia]